MKAYLRIALRNLYREKLYAAINIAGLSLAIACCIVLAMYLHGELTYDQHNVNYNKIFRVVNEFNTNGTVESFAVTSAQLGPMLKEAYPEVQDYVRFQPAPTRLMLRHGEDAYYWDNVYFADPNVFQTFTHDIIAGDPQKALTEPNSIAVSETFARRYFGDANPIGEVMLNDNGALMRIDVVFTDQPANSHFRYDVLFSANQAFLRGPDNTTARRQQLWGIGWYTYLVMAENYNPNDYLTLNADFYEKNMAERGKSLNGTWRSWIEPLADIHYSSTVGYDQPKGNRFYLFGFAAVAIFILIVASINYVNLATARATKRARAVGIRKILGAERGALIAQFVGEAVLFALIAAVFGVVIVEVLLTVAPVEQLIGKPLNLSFGEQPWLAGLIFGLAAVLGVLAGLYPAFYLSSWAPLTALVGRYQAGKASVRFRQALVFTQFAISIAVIASTLLMGAQMRFIASKGLGFEKDNRVMVTLRGVNVLEQIPTITNELSKDPHVLGVTTTSAMMGQTVPVNIMSVENNEGQQQNTTFSHMTVGDNFLRVMGMKLAAGRDFSKKLLTDVGTAMIVNEAFVRTMGWSEPLGKRINNGRVIGVIEDFNFKSLQYPMEPFALHPFEDDFTNVPEIQRPFVTRLLVLNIAGEDIGQTLRFIGQTYAKFDPVHPFEYKFVDDSLNELYTSEQQLMRLIGVFAVICIFIACLGLFGLAAFTTEQRTKEIGIRKVIGASTGQIILLLSKNTLLLILAGAVLASALAYLAINEWLAGFAYRAPINPLVFVIATAVAALVAFLTIALQSYGTVRGDPVDALRYE